MPEADRDPEVILHPLAQDEPVRIVDAVGEGILGVQAGRRDPTRDVGKEGVTHVRILRDLAPGGMCGERTRSFVQQGDKPSGGTTATSRRGAAPAPRGPRLGRRRPTAIPW